MPTYLASHLSLTAQVRLGTEAAACGKQMLALHGLSVRQHSICIQVSLTFFSRVGGSKESAICDYVPHQ